MPARWHFNIISYAYIRLPTRSVFDVEHSRSRRRQLVSIYMHVGYKYIETPALTIYIWWDEMRKLTFNRNTNMPPEPLSMLSAWLPAFDGQKLKRHRKKPLLRHCSLVVLLLSNSTQRSWCIDSMCDAMREWVRVRFLSIKQHTTRCANACLKCMN